MEPKELRKAINRSFWNSCPQKLGYFPETACPLGKYSAETKDTEKGCPWYVNSEQDNYCFWKWVRRVSNEEGFMEPLLQHEISELLCMSTTKIHASFKEALEIIQEYEEFEDLRDYFGE